MEEIWKDVNGYSGLYQVSNLGRVRSVDRMITYSDGRNFKYKQKILNWNIGTKSRRCYVHLYQNSKRKGMLIHRLVAIAFLENPLNLPEINHIDGNTLNNQVSNLEWISHLDNMQHGFRTGLINNTGVLHGNNKYTEDQILKVIGLIKEGSTSIQIEKLTNVKAATVNAIRKGSQWRHLND